MNDTPIKTPTKSAQDAPAQEVEETKSHPHGSQRATADHLAEKAALLFAKKGFASTSIREIAEAAGVTKPTLYYHFGSKDGLVEHIVRTAMDGYFEDLAAALQTPDLQTGLEHLATKMLEFAETRPATMLLLARIHTQPQGEFGCIEVQSLRRQTMLQMGAFFQKAIDAGQLAPANIEVLTLGFHGALHLHQLRRLIPDSPVLPPAEAAHQMVSLFLHGALT